MECLEAVEVLCADHKLCYSVLWGLVVRCSEDKKYTQIVMFAIEQARKAPKGSRCIAVLFI